jgi:hypothetical protein
MKRWIGSEVPPGQFGESWLRVLAGALRNWLGGFLGKGERSTSGDGRTPQRPVVVPQDIEGLISQLPSSQGEQPTATRWNPFKPKGPPEEWLKIVREGAPKLLIPSEEGGTRWHRASHVPAGSEPSEPSMRQTVPDPFRPSGPVKSEKSPSTPAGTSSDITALIKPNWLQYLKRGIETGVLDAGRKKETKKEEESQPSRPVAPQHVSSSAPLWSEQGGAASTERRQVSQLYSGDSVPLPLTQDRRKTSPIPAWVEPVKRRLRQLLDVGRTDRRDTRIKSTKTEVALGRTAPMGDAISPAATHDVATRQFTRESGISLGPTPELIRLPRASEEVRHEADTARQQRVETDTHAVTVNLKRMPGLPLELDSPTPSTQSGTSEGGELEPVKIGFDQGMFRPPQSPAARPNPEHRKVASHWSPEADRDDRWPDLPPEQPPARENTMHLLRSSERLHALDLEQRGGR